MNEPKDQATGTPSACHCPALREIVSVVHAEMDSAWNRGAIQREHVHRWGAMLRDALGSEYTDSSWLQSIGFIKDATRHYYRMNNWLVLKCEAGKWQAYSVKSSHWHYLCDVDLRKEVTDLINALKLNA
jgi:hypothetical protein